MPNAAPSTRGDDITLKFASNFNMPLFMLPVKVFGGILSDHGIQRKQFVSVPVMEDVIENGAPKVDADGKVVRVQKTVTVDVLDDAGNPTGQTEEKPLFEDHPVGSQNFDKITNEVVPYGDIVRKIETEHGFVYVEDHEIETLFDLDARTLVVDSFQPLALFYQGHYVPKSLSHLEPQPIKVGKRKERNRDVDITFYAILEAMRDEGSMALCTLTTRGKAKPCALLPDGSLWLFHHTDAVREQRPRIEVTVPAPVVTQLRELIAATVGTTPTDLTDEHSLLIQGFAEEKAAAGDFGKVPEPEATEEKEFDSSNLMAALGGAVAAAKAARAS